MPHDFLRYTVQPWDDVPYWLGYNVEEECLLSADPFGTTRMALWFSCESEWIQKLQAGEGWGELEDWQVEQLRHWTEQGERDTWEGIDRD